FVERLVGRCFLRRFFGFGFGRRPGRRVVGRGLLSWWWVLLSLLSVCFVECWCGAQVRRTCPRETSGHPPRPRRPLSARLPLSSFPQRLQLPRFFRCLQSLAFPRLLWCLQHPAYHRLLGCLQSSAFPQLLGCL